MRVSLNWVKNINSKYAASADPAPDGIEKLVEKIGAQLGAVDELTAIGNRYQKVTLVRVASIEKHPNADKLTVCWVDDGAKIKNIRRNQKGLVQVVCGAPNVSEGMLAAWLPPGAIVPSTFDKDPFVLKARDIRGVLSNGMLASPKELGFGESHDGLLKIEGNHSPGTPLSEVLGLDDYIIDIENKMFTHRPDLFGMLGIARELAGIQNHVFKSPAWYSHTSALPRGNNRGAIPLVVENKLPGLVPRFMAAVIKDVNVQTSPAWLQSYIGRIGMRPVNNIVDLTNFLMLETGQPLHAYDYDKVKALNSHSGPARLIVRQSLKGEELKLLGGKKLVLSKGAVVIATGGGVIGLGGVMGGADTEVDEKTKTIILECGTFDKNTTRKTAMAYGLFTDAATRFTKEQSPLQNAPVITKAISEILRLAGGRLVGNVIDSNHVDLETQKRGNLNPAVNVSTDFIKSRLGIELSAEKIQKLLQNVEFKVTVKGDNLSVSAPFWRTDIKIPEDIVEEVGRLYGFDHLPLVLPFKDLKPAGPNSELVFNNVLRDILTSAGANEVLTYSFVDDRLLKQAGQSKSNAFHIRNALSPDLKYYRLSLLPSLLAKVAPNIKKSFEDFALYEIGRVYLKKAIGKEGLPEEQRRMALVRASKNKAEGAPYYQVKVFADFLIRRLNAKKYKIAPLHKQPISYAWQDSAAGFEPEHAAALTVEGQILGIIGEPAIGLSRSLKLPPNTSMLELDLKLLRRISSGLGYSSLNRYPETSQDICFRTEFTTSFAALEESVAKAVDIIAKGAGYTWSMEAIDIFKKDQDPKHKQITWRIVLSHPKRTLTTGETNILVNDVAAAVKKKTGAVKV